MKTSLNRIEIRNGILITLLIFLHTALFGQNSNNDANDLLDMSLEDLVNLEVTTATKTSINVNSAPALIEVITAEQILTRGYTTLSEVLQDLPNMHQDKYNWGIGEPISQNVGFGFRFDTWQSVLLLFNGQRLNAFLPGNRFGGEEFLLETIERIEIIRGPGSAIYGTGAFTTVVNIISKQNIDNQSEEFKINTTYIPTSRGFSVGNSFANEIGTKSSLVGGFRYFTEEGQKLQINNALFGDGFNYDGVDHAIDAELVFNHGEFNLYSKITNQKRNTFTGFNSFSPSNMDELKLSMHAYSIGSDYTLTLNKNSTIKINAGWHQDNWTEVALIPQFKLTEAEDDLLLDESGIPILDTLSLYRNGEFINTSFFIDGQGADTRSLDSEIQYTLNYSNKNGNNNLVIGAYFSEDRILKAERPTELNLDPFGFVPFRVINDDTNNWLFDVNSSRTTIALYSQIDYNILNNLSVTLGGRYDIFSGTGALQGQNYQEFNPRGALVYSNHFLGIFKLLYGNATRIPNGFETLSAVAILGNPNNRPERMKMAQLHWIKNWKSNLRSEFGLFRAEIENRLITNADISPLLQAQGFIGQFINISDNARQLNNGIEGKVDYKINDFNISGNFTQYFGSNNGYGQPIAYIPKTMLNTNLSYSVDALKLNIGLNYRSNFTKAPEDFRPTVPTYLIGRTNIVYSPISKPYSFNLLIRNMFNTTYQFPSSSLDFTNHFPARGIEVLLGANFTFK